MLGICFGAQLLSRALGGEVTRQAAPHIAWESPDTDIEALRAPWVLLHNDAFTVPPGADVLAEADHAPMAFRYGRAWGVQFHPEVHHTPNGAKLYENFVKLAGFKGDWTMGAYREEAIRAIREQVGDAHVICGLSGGVDSSVSSAWISLML